jgi:hypothetical protein
MGTKGAFCFWLVEKFCTDGAPGVTRTRSLLIRSQLLYPLSYGCLPEYRGE